MIGRRLVAAALFLACAAAAFAGTPKFYGAREARGSVGAVALSWERATPSRPAAKVQYRIYQQTAKGFDYTKPIAEVAGTDYVVTGLKPGTQHAFVVRAAEPDGVEANTRVVKAKTLTAEPAAEWRGVWISRFEWTGGDAAAIRERLARMMRSLGRGNFNAVVFQVRGQMDTLYPSSIEPWSPMLGADAQKIDPVDIAIREARRNGLQFHAWMNLLVAWQSKERQYPGDRSHPFYEWCHPGDPSRRKGVIHDAGGKPFFWGEANYVWLTPGNPDLQLHLRNVVREFLDRYPVDGLHWDDRTALPHGASNDPVSLARFRGRGNPDKIPTLHAWQMDQVERLLEAIYVESTARNPRLLVTASPFGIYDKTRLRGYSGFKDCRTDFGTDGERWLRAGILDALMPQIYWAEGDPAPSYGELVRDWVRNNRSGRPIWPGSALGNYGGKQPLGSVQARYVALARSLGCGGNTFFSYTEATDAEWSAASGTIYRGRAAVPVPLHKTRPATGQIMGAITDANGKPLVDAWVRLPGRARTALTGADGFFAIGNVPPGKHTLTIEWANGRRTEALAEVKAGKTEVVMVRVN